MSLRKELIKLAHGRPELRKHLVPLLKQTKTAGTFKYEGNTALDMAYAMDDLLADLKRKLPVGSIRAEAAEVTKALRKLENAVKKAEKSKAKTARADKSWDDYDRSAPKTPWGPAQDAYVIDRGVAWYSTAGHGGMKVARGVAQKMLSDAARKMGDLWGGAYWYEEDVGWAIPCYEVPKWDALLTRKLGGSIHTKDMLGKIIERNYPKYFKLLEEDFAMPAPLKPGDTVEFKINIPFSGGITFKPGQQVTVRKVDRSNFIFQAGGGLYRLKLRYYEDGDVVKV